MFNLKVFNWEGDWPPEGCEQSRARGAWELVAFEGKWGARDRETGKYILPCSYDNAFYHGERAVVLCDAGKWGAVEVARNPRSHETDDGLSWITDCEWDTVEASSWGLLFSTRSKILFYHEDTGKTREFGQLNAYSPDGRFLFGKAGETFLLVDRQDGEAIWEGAEGDPHYALGSPQLAYMGSVGGTPLFFDYFNGGCLVPQNGVLSWSEDLQIVVQPFVVNGENVVNVVGNGRREGLVSFKPDDAGRILDTLQEQGAPCPYERLSVDFVVTMEGLHGTERVTYRIADYAPDERPASRL